MLSSLFLLGTLASTAFAATCPDSPFFATRAQPFNIIAEYNNSGVSGRITTARASPYTTSLLVSSLSSSPTFVNQSSSTYTITNGVIRSNIDASKPFAYLRGTKSGAPLGIQFITDAAASARGIIPTRFIGTNTCRQLSGGRIEEKLTIAPWNSSLAFGFQYYDRSSGPFYLNLFPKGFRYDNQNVDADRTYTSFSGDQLVLLDQ